MNVMKGVMSLLQAAGLRQTALQASAAPWFSDHHEGSTPCHEMTFGLRPYGSGTQRKPTSPLTDEQVARSECLT